MRKNFKRVNTLIRVVLVVLTITAIYKEIRKPREERQWHGKVAGFVPYDFRFPTMTRIRERLWNPDDPRIITERVFGLGWTINFYSVGRLLQRLRSQEDTSQESDSLAQQN